MTSTALACAEQAHSKQEMPTGLCWQWEKRTSLEYGPSNSQTLSTSWVLVTGRQGFKWKAFSLPMCGLSIFKLCVKISLKNYKIIHWLETGDSSCGEMAGSRMAPDSTMENVYHHCQSCRLSNGSGIFTLYTVHLIHKPPYSNRNPLLSRIIVVWTELITLNISRDKLSISQSTKTLLWSLTAAVKSALHHKEPAHLYYHFFCGFPVTFLLNQEIL